MEDLAIWQGTTQSATTRKASEKRKNIQILLELIRTKAARKESKRDERPRVENQREANLKEQSDAWTKEKQMEHHP